VALLDMDVYSPSLLSYFDLSPRKWLNDYLSGDAESSEVLTKITPTRSKYGADSFAEGGELWIACSDSRKDAIYKVETGSGGGEVTAKRDSLRRFIRLRNDLTAELNFDHVLVDTSPGIRYWSINSLAIANTILLTLKAGDLDLMGTKNVAKELYGSLTQYGTKSCLLFNRVTGYCIPNHVLHQEMVEKGKSISLAEERRQEDSAELISKSLEMDIISSIPCYCDIQFKEREFLIALQNPKHPFAMQIEKLASSQVFQASA
jgi:chromosome partitioning protein